MEKGSQNNDTQPGDKVEPVAAPRAVPPLTDREVDILTCLPTRLSIEDIAARLHISPNTVKTHLKNLYRKLGATSRNQAIAKAVEADLLTAQTPALPPHGAKRHDMSS